MLKIRRLHSEGSYETPFDKNIDGFEEKWWSQLVFDAMSSRDEFYSFTNEAEEEVAPIFSMVTINCTYRSQRGTVELCERPHCIAYSLLDNQECFDVHSHTVMPSPHTLANRQYWSYPQSF